jgi:hypothetical protein
MMNIGAAMDQSIQWQANETEYRITFVRFLVQARCFSFSENSIPYPGPTLPSIHCVPADLLPGVKWLSREADDLHLLPELRMRGAIPPVYRMFSWPIYWQYSFTHGVRLRPLDSRDCGFESLPVHCCLSVMNVVCCQVEVSVSGRSLVQGIPTECVCESLSVIMCYNYPLHLQWVDRRKWNLKKYRSFFRSFHRTEILLNRVSNLNLPKNKQERAET